MCRGFPDRHVRIARQGLRRFCRPSRRPFEAEPEWNIASWWSDLGVTLQLQATGPSSRHGARVPHRNARVPRPETFHGCITDVSQTRPHSAGTEATTSTGPAQQACLCRVRRPGAPSFGGTRHVQSGSSRQVADTSCQLCVMRRVSGVG